MSSSRSARRVVAVDVDECLFDFLGAYAQWRADEGLVSFRVEHMTGYGVATLLGQSRDEARADEMRFLRERSAELAPMPGAIEAVEALATSAELHVVTARCDELSREVTEEWVARWFGDAFAGVHMKSLSAPGRTKGDVCAEISADVLIDDSPANLATLAGTRGILLGHWPWTFSLQGDWVHAPDWDRAIPLASST
jgi:5'(3')-deoxyribonucleotidase